MSATKASVPGSWHTGLQEHMNKTQQGTHFSLLWAILLKMALLTLFCGGIKFMCAYFMCF